MQMMFNDDDLKELLNKIVLLDSKKKAIKEYQSFNFKKKNLKLSENTINKNIYTDEYYKMYCEIQKLQDSIVEFGLDMFNKLNV
jgi:hypothetical protein